MCQHEWKPVDHSEIQLKMKSHFKLDFLFFPFFHVFRNVELKHSVNLNAFFELRN